MPAPVPSTQNRLLLALPARSYRALSQDLEAVPMHNGTVFSEVDEHLGHVYFPDIGVISIVAVYPDGNTIEMATIGREGATSFQVALGAKKSSARLLVQLPGRAKRMPVKAFRKHFENDPSFHSLIQSHIQAFMEQVMISAACNGAHSLRERLARWLLMMLDRFDDNVLPITQSLLAEMLGVQRPSVTKILKPLEKARIIDGARGRIIVLDRDGLRRVSCECYGLARMRIAHNLPKTYPENSSM